MMEDTSHGERTLSGNVVLGKESSCEDVKSVRVTRLSSPCGLDRDRNDELAER